MYMHCSRESFSTYSRSDIEVWSKLRNFDRELLAEVKEDLTHQDSGKAGCLVCG